MMIDQVNRTEMAGVFDYTDEKNGEVYTVIWFNHRKGGTRRQVTVKRSDLLRELLINHYELDALYEDFRRRKDDD